MLLPLAPRPTTVSVARREPSSPLSSPMGRAQYELVWTMASGGILASILAFLGRRGGRLEKKMEKEKTGLLNSFLLPCAISDNVRSRSVSRISAKMRAWLSDRRKGATAGPSLRIDEA